MLQVLPAPVLAAWQEPEPVVEIGAPPILEQAWSFVGQTQATPDDVVVTGRLTAVSGLDPATSAGDDAAPASRFTFVAELTPTGEANGADTVTRTGEGVLTIYLHDGSPLDGADPATFRSGPAVAEFAAEFRHSVLVQAPGQGVVAGRMRLVQSESFTFPLDDAQYRFGHAGLELTARYTGGLIAGAGDATIARAGVFGAATVSRRAANPTDTGEASPTTELSDCELLLAWIEGTRSRLNIANTFRANVLSGDVIRFDDLNVASTGVAALATVQRAQPVPEGAGAAADLALIALSTDARGFELLVSAVEAEDEAAVSQAVAILTDGAALTDRALTALEEITPACEPPS